MCNLPEDGTIKSISDGIPITCAQCRNIRETGARKRPNLSRHRSDIIKPPDPSTVTTVTPKPLLNASLAIYNYVTKLRARYERACLGKGDFDAKEYLKLVDTLFLNYQSATATCKGASDRAHSLVKDRARELENPRRGKARLEDDEEVVPGVPVAAKKITRDQWTIANGILRDLQQLSLIVENLKDADEEYTLFSSDDPVANLIDAARAVERRLLTDARGRTNAEGELPHLPALVPGGPKIDADKYIAVIASHIHETADAKCEAVTVVPVESEVQTLVNLCGETHIQDWIGFISSIDEWWSKRLDSSPGEST